jgi:hypothetical protein
MNLRGVVLWSCWLPEWEKKSVTTEESRGGETERGSVAVAAEVRGSGVGYSVRFVRVHRPSTDRGNLDHAQTRAWAAGRATRARPLRCWLGHGRAVPA